MTRSSDNMRERRRALRNKVEGQRREHQTRLRAQFAPMLHERKKRRRRRVLKVVILALLILLALLSRCNCDEAETPALAPPQAVEPKPAPKPVRVASKAPPISARSPMLPRTAFEGDKSPEPAWLEAYRLQVAARSPRLAACFEGTDRPGALRWTAAVNSESGQVSDHAVEPLGSTLELSTRQKECLLDGLSWPLYKLPQSKDAPSTSPRIALVIEF